MRRKQPSKMPTVIQPNAADNITKFNPCRVADATESTGATLGMFISVLERVLNYHRQHR